MYFIPILLLGIFTKWPIYFNLINLFELTMADVAVNLPSPPSQLLSLFILDWSILLRLQFLNIFGVHNISHVLIYIYTPLLEKYPTILLRKPGGFH